MAAFTEMGPGASLHYLMTGDQQNVANTAHQQAYSFIYGAPSQLVPSYQQQQQQITQTQQIQQRPRQGSGLPPTPPGSPRPHNNNNNNNTNNAAVVLSGIKQQPGSTFASPVRTQHPSQPQALPLYPQPSPLHPNIQNMNGDSSAIFMKQQSQQQPIFQWTGQQVVQPSQIATQPQQPPQQNNPVPTMYDSSTSFPVPCNFCDQFAQQYQQQAQNAAVSSTTQQVVPNSSSCSLSNSNHLVGLSHHNQNVMKREVSLDPFRSACRAVTTAVNANNWVETSPSTTGTGSLLMTRAISIDDSPLAYNSPSYRGCNFQVNNVGNIGGGLLQTVTTNHSTASFPAVISARDSFATSPSLVHALSQAAQQRRQRSEKKQVPDDLKDDKYYERRKRNNVAAKKSRDSRKAREDEIAIRASFLEKENAILRAQVATLRDEATSLRQLLLQKQVTNPTSSSQLGSRPTATSTPNPKQTFTLGPQQQQQQPSQHNQTTLAQVVAQQAAAAAYAAAFATTNMHHNQPVDNQPSQQQEIINSAA